ncbi:MAG TPA: tetratricopeptide repeat protein [Thermoanaerobaculia bacterium]|nr:tetratricopeptide repeat protein [Thermoanaerobaculia bacterium]
MARFEAGGWDRTAWRIFLLGLVLLAPGFRAYAEEMTPEEQIYTIREGVTLHEQGDFDGALAKYRQVLAVNPKNVTALYEMSFTFAARKDWRACYETAEKALRLESPIRPMIYVTAGSCYDAGGEPKKAISLFKRGLRESPEDAGLRFNLAVVYLRLGDNSEALSALERTVKAEPKYLTANFALGELYAQSGQRIPALLAHLRYLSLDSESERAGTAAQAVKGLLWQGVTSDGPDKVTVSVSKDSTKGPFAGAEMILSLLAASRYLPESKDKTEHQLIAAMLDTLFSSMAEMAGERKGKCFPCDQFGLYFGEMKANGLVEPFVYVALESLDPKGSTDWQQANPKKVADLKAWLGDQKPHRPQTIG